MLLAREQRMLATAACDNPKIKRQERDWPEVSTLSGNRAPCCHAVTWGAGF